YLDVWVPPRVRKTLPVESSRHAFAYIFAGSGTFRDASPPRGVRTEWVGKEGAQAEARDQTGNRSLVLFDSGDEITVQAGDAGIRFLLVSGRPIAEPVAWQGPIVMNTEAELGRAYAEQHDQELLPAVPRHAVHRARRLPQDLSDLRERRVAREVAVRVVVRLEVIDVCQQDRERAPESPRPLRFARQRVHQMPPVVEAGE